MRRLMSVLYALSLCVLAACAAPQSNDVQAATPAAATQATASAPVTIDRSCRSDADCTIKNVGNCCGEMPSCVNKNSPTDPAGVQAACQRSGRMSICGFKAIESCQCVKGSCEDQVQQVETVH